MFLGFVWEFLICLGIRLFYCVFGPWPLAGHGHHGLIYYFTFILIQAGPDLAGPRDPRTAGQPDRRTLCRAPMSIPSVVWRRYRYRSKAHNDSYQILVSNPTPELSRIGLKAKYLKKKLQKMLWDVLVHCFVMNEVFWRFQKLSIIRV